MNKRYRIYRRMLMLVCAAVTVLLFITVYRDLQNSVPDEIRIINGREEQLDLDTPITGVIYTPPQDDMIEASAMNGVKVNLSKPTTFITSTTGRYVMDCRLFGVVPLKQVDFAVIEDTSLLPAGIPIGIFVETDGVLVISSGTVRGLDGTDYAPAEHILNTGDYIEQVNHVELTDKKDLIRYVSDSGGEELILDIRRGSERFQTKVTPVMSADGVYKIGVWVRDNIQGIGTLTFVDDDLRFGALGHGINDVDTALLMEVDSGTLYHTQIMSVIRGENGKPGELTGMIDYLPENVLGEITSNTNHGVFGTGNESILKAVSGEALQIGLKQDIEMGPAQIICSLNGERETYQVEIKSIDLTADSVNRGIVLEVTDERLLSMTGGIVQGMSGSPIIQNHKIIGAVTHVFVQDSTKGFGIFIENMLEK
ncbi:MAG: SpoIVB peptidase [bacterium]|nr:SpoIVB peptidase [bacterium]